jgi:hypothetical protein
MRLTQEQLDSIVAKRVRGDTLSKLVKAKRSKYGNKPTVVNGEQFDSGKEARRYEELLLLERAGKISQLRHHVTYPLEVNGVVICEYELDLQYVDEAGQRHYEDVKSKATVTQLYKVKKRLMAACHGIEIREVVA